MKINDFEPGTEAWWNFIISLNRLKNALYCLRHGIPIPNDYFKEGEIEDGYKINVERTIE